MQYSGGATPASYASLLLDQAADGASSERGARTACGTAGKGGEGSTSNLQMRWMLCWGILVVAVVPRSYCTRLRLDACCLPLRARRRQRARALWRLTCARTLLGRHYDARARGVLRRVARELRVPWQVCEAAVLPHGLFTLLPAQSCGPRASSLRRVGLGFDASGRGLEHLSCRPRAPLLRVPLPYVARADHGKAALPHALGSARSAMRPTCLTR